MNIKWTEEKLERLCINLLEWAIKSDSLVITQFLFEQKISYNNLKHIKSKYENVKEAFGITLAILASRWLEKAQDPKLSKGMLRLLSKYMPIYDRFLYEQEKELHKEAVKALASYKIEDYSKTNLDNPYDKIYEKNINKKNNVSKC